MQKINSNRNSVLPLTALKNGDKAVVASIKTDDRQKLRKLAAFGILPGVSISVIQKYPAIVLQVGFTQVALDEAIGSEIIVNGMK